VAPAAAEVAPAAAAARVLAAAPAAQTSREAIFVSVGEYAEDVGASEAWRQDVAELKKASAKAKLLFYTIYAVCSAIMYLAPLMCIIAPMLPQKAQIYIVCIGGGAVLFAKTLMQFVHPKRRAARHALVEQEADVLQSTPDAEDEEARTQVKKLKCVHITRSLGQSDISAVSALGPAQLRRPPRAPKSGPAPAAL
jgi:hypothetical protein